MKPDIFGLASDGNPYLAQWLEAVERDAEAGLIPSWVGAVIVSVRDDGTSASMTFIKRDRWIAVRFSQQIGLN